MAARNPAEVFPPGDYLREELEERGWTQSDLAAVLGCNVRTVNELVTGKRGITPETAKGLGFAFGTGPELWLNLDQMYKLARLGYEDDTSVARRAALYSYAPVSEMVKRGWIIHSENVDVLRNRVLSFLGVNDIGERPRLTDDCHFRKTAPITKDTPAQMAWLVRGYHLAQRAKAGDFVPEKMDGLIQALKQLIPKPDEVGRVPTLLAEFGIRFVIVQPLPSSRVDGAFFWLDSEKTSSPVIVMSLRFDRLDSFWFTLLHECAHCMLRHSGSMDVDVDSARGRDDRGDNEREADALAQITLLDPKVLNGFIARTRPYYSARSIESLARTLGTHPGIIVGQLQHRGEIGWSNFRKTLVPVRDCLTSASITDGWNTVASGVS